MGHGPVKIDPAIERFNTMREEAYLSFRWTRRTVRTAVLGFVVFPAAVFLIASKYHLRWDYSGKLKGESLATVVSPSQSNDED
ncbi:hypothetical protein GALMADRAFT_251085 [Galerina marginata CBS 339.88]|uniref:NADH-ubiquinone oxidoreductase B15 subunit n=1 Tax=Galerina marginata (strain CBS 339.88) TaxID=685588 RepID=A0A067T362_GALM3|nr:hypothetical protein GALMADRAFT_251085 [Galerina marginata CBS 339.88]